MNKVLLSIGTNLGDRVANLRGAVDALVAVGGVVAEVSSIYESEAVGGRAEGRFLNAAVRCSTILSPQRFISVVHDIEKNLGRVRTERWGNRCIDLDILLWQKKNTDSVIVNLPHLRIPHPRVLHRDFVLFPAAEIAAWWQHPFSGQNLRTAKKKIKSESIVRKLKFL